MLLRDSFPELPRWTVRIIASDISPTMLARCRAGRYSQLEVYRGLPPSTLITHMSRDGAVWVVYPDPRCILRPPRMHLPNPLPALPTSTLTFIRYRTTILPVTPHTHNL